MSDLQLMQDYFWILENCEDPDVKFSESPAEKEFASMWLSKLCNDIYWGPDAKRLRNQYLSELATCIYNAKLNKLFMQPPPRGPLAPYEGASNIKIDPKTVVAEMNVDAADQIPIISPRNYQTHMSTKIFDDNRGACAYLAVSLGDPKQGPVWMQMGSKTPFSKNTNNNKNGKCPQQQQQQQQCRPNACRSNRQLAAAASSGGFSEGDGKVNVGFGEFCLDAIAKELAGQATPCQCPELELQLKKYAVFIKNYPIGEEAKNLTGTKLRNFLLLNLQTDLVQALEACH